jgi:hypothetical protein
VKKLSVACGNLERKVPGTAWPLPEQCSVAQGSVQPIGSIARRSEAGARPGEPFANVRVENRATALSCICTGGLIFRKLSAARRMSQA